MILISNLSLVVSDEGSAIASTEIYGDDKKTYVNIGSGNVFRLSWDPLNLTNDNDRVDYYKLVIKRHDTTLDVYYDIFDKNIGLVNEFYVESSLLPTIPAQYMLSIYVVAYSKAGSIITSNVVNPYISKGTGIYVKAQPEGYAQPIMKRALALAYAPTSAEYTAVLVDRDGKELLSKDNKRLIVQATRVLSSNDWNIMQEGYIKDVNGNWQASDIKYEILVDKDGDIIVDKDNDQIYVL